MNVVKPGLYMVPLPSKKHVWVHVVPPAECEPTEPAIDVAFADDDEITAVSC